VVFLPAAAEGLLLRRRRPRRGRRGHRAADPDASALTADGRGAVPGSYLVCTQGQPRSTTRHLTAISWGESDGLFRQDPKPVIRRHRPAARCPNPTGYRCLLLAFLLLGGVQIFLAGLGAFRLGHPDASADVAFAPHRAVGFAMGGLALVIFILALISRPGVRAIVASAVLFLLASLADNTVIFGGLHALDGLAILCIAAFPYASARRRGHAR
jgi:hypothetical protein